MAATGGFCTNCFRGTLRGDVEPAGIVETIYGLPAYIARPDNGRQPEGLVVVISDAFGWEFRNTRALADAYARRGPFLVYLPDFQNGQSPYASSESTPPDGVLTEMPSIGHAPDPSLILLVDKLHARNKSWATTLFKVPIWWIQWLFITACTFWYIRPGRCRPRIWGFFKALRDSPPHEPLAGHLKVGVAGFCWGGLFCIQLCGEPNLVTCGFTAHPSLLTVPRDIEAVQRPLSVGNGENDEWMGRKRMDKLKEILEAKEDMEVVVYDGAQHGFAVRGDPHDPRQAELGMLAEDQAVAWYRKHLTG